MPNQFGTRRHTKNPLQDYIDLQQKRVQLEQSRQASAESSLKNVKHRDVYKKGDEYFERSNVAGSIEDVPITKDGYTVAKQSNALANKNRKTAGLPTINPNPDQGVAKEEPSLTSKVVNKVGELIGTGKDAYNRYATKRSEDAQAKSKTPVKIQPSGDTGRDILQLNNNNVTGTNIDVGKSASVGGEVKVDLNKEPKPIIKDTPNGLPMDVTAKDDTEPIQSQGAGLGFNLDVARKKSLKDRQDRKLGYEFDKRGVRKSLKGTAAPNTSERFLANAKQKADKVKKGRMAEFERQSAERSKDFTARKIGEGSVTAQQTRELGDTLDGGYKKSYERANKLEDMSPKQRLAAQYTKGRLKLPSTRRGDTEVSDIVQSNRKKVELAKAKYSPSVDSQQPDSVKDFAKGDKLKSSYVGLPDYKGALTVVPLEKGTPSIASPSRRRVVYASSSKKKNPTKVKMNSAYFKETRKGKEFRKSVGKNVSDANTSVIGAAEKFLKFKRNQ